MFGKEISVPTVEEESLYCNGIKAIVTVECNNKNVTNQYVSWVAGHLSNTTISICQIDEWYS